MRYNTNWFSPIFKLNRFYAGHEVSGFVFMGIEMDFRPWYVFKITEEDKKNPSYAEFYFDKDGWAKCWDTREEKDESIADDPTSIYKRISLWKTTQFPMWMRPQTLLIFLTGVAVGILFTQYFLVS